MLSLIKEQHVHLCELLESEELHDGERDEAVLRGVWLLVVGHGVLCKMHQLPLATKLRRHIVLAVEDRFEWIARDVERDIGKEVVIQDSVLSARRGSAVPSVRTSRGFAVFYLLLPLLRFR